MCSRCGWETFVARIDEMLDERRFRYAYPTLRGIRDTVTQQRHATEQQSRAVDNIEKNTK